MPAAPSSVAEVVELALPPRPEVVSVVRLVVGALVSADPMFDEERSADVRLALSEACTNAIEAQEICTEHPAEPILVRCTVTEGHLEFSVTDHGSGFDPEALPSHPDVADPARLDYESGLGIPLIRLLSDHVEFQVSPGGTTVMMTFEPRPAGGEALLQPTGT